MHSTWIAVPTYWGYPGGSAGPVTTVFDHPTPVDTEGTLAATLESFTALEGDFSVIIVVGVSHASLAEQAHRQVTTIVQRFASDLQCYILSPVNLDAFNDAIDEPILSLTSYGNIRNVQLAVPYAMGAGIVVGIDDDEIIEDPRFLDKAREFTGTEREGRFVGGVSGPYLDDHGEWRMEGAEELGDLDNIHRKKNYFMNEALKNVMVASVPGDIVPSNVAFGGNMTVARRTIGRICFDPYIPRGEDYDYVITALMDGLGWFYRPDMTITHLPPDATGSQAGDNMQKMISDIRRFIYVRAKWELGRELYPDETIDLDLLMPYPGSYLVEGLDLAAEGVKALDEMYPQYRGDGGSPEELVAESHGAARQRGADFFAYRDRWRRAMAHLADCDAARLAARGFAVKAGR